MIEALLYYLGRGCSLIRLDAVAYLWKEEHTPCVHLPQTHTVIKLIREILELLAPQVLVITETNVPHDDNISYFGEGHDEAHMVYNFALPPLTLLSFTEGSARALSSWAKTLATQSDTTTFFNFLDSHDGIGLRPVQGLIGDREQEARRVNRMAERAKQQGGLIYMAANPDGSKSPYEMNTTWWSALYQSGDDKDTNINRYIASRAVALCLAGVPGIYLHGLLGSANDLDAVEKTQHNRDISRRILHYDELDADIASGPKTARIFEQYINLLKLRRQQSAFHPNAAQEILDLDERVFCVKRSSADETILSLINVSDERVELQLPSTGIDLIAGEGLSNNVTIAPYQVMWVKQRA